MDTGSRYVLPTLDISSPFFELGIAVDTGSKYVLPTLDKPASLIAQGAAACWTHLASNLYIHNKRVVKILRL